MGGTAAGQDHFGLDLPRAGAEIARCEHQALIDLLHPGIGAHHDRKECADRTHDDVVSLAGAEPDDHQRNERDFRQRIERGKPLILTLRRSGAPFALRPTDLYRESLLTSGAITNRIDRVEKQGLVRRRQDPNDGRAMVVQLTAAGRRLADKAAAIHFRALAETFSGLSKQECAQLNASLAKLLSVVDTE
jgi:DNA-binding MarR family transcriptional regulator